MSYLNHFGEGLDARRDTAEQADTDWKMRDEEGSPMYLRGGFFELACEIAQSPAEIERKLRHTAKLQAIVGPALFAIDRNHKF